MPQQTLLSSSEVLYYASHHYSLSASDVQKQIYLQERKAAAGSIGRDFFTLLLSDKNDYIGFPDWAPGTWYQGDVVWRLGLAYQVQTTDTTQDPNGGSDWALAPKFFTACYQSLWDEGLAAFLSNIIMAASANSIAYKVAPGGIVQINAQDAQQAATDRTQAVAEKFRTDANEWWELAVQFARENNAVGESCEGEFAEFLPVKQWISCSTEDERRRLLGRARQQYMIMGNNYVHPNDLRW
jgi:hypothetical protein